MRINTTPCVVIAPGLMLQDRRPGPRFGTRPVGEYQEELLYTQVYSGPTCLANEGAETNACFPGRRYPDPVLKPYLKSSRKLNLTDRGAWKDCGKPKR